MTFADDGEGVPDFVGARDRVVDQLVAFARALRGAGARVPANASIVAARTLVEVGFDDEERARAALRAALVTRREDLPAFERTFPVFWRRLTGGSSAYEDSYEPGQTPDGEFAPPDAGGGGGADADPEPPDGEEPTRVESLGSAVSGASEGDGGEEGESATASVYSPSGRSEPIAARPAALDRDENLDRSLRALTTAIASLRGRRWALSGDRRVDTRRALRRSFSTGGTVISVPERERKRAAVRAVVLVDVSQSVLDTIDRGFLIDFLRRASEEWRSVRVFLFDTSLREATREFDAPTATDALSALERAEAEWGGGTRIGHAVETVRREHPDAVDRDTVVFVVSDGLEVGEIDRLESGMSWLSRRAGAVLWLNPLAASPEYEPTCRGMASALPYVDGLFAFTGPDDVAEVARQIEQQGIGGHVGYQYDPRRFEAADG